MWLSESNLWLKRNGQAKLRNAKKYANDFQRKVNEMTGGVQVYCFHSLNVKTQHIWSDNSRTYWRCFCLKLFFSSPTVCQITSRPWGPELTLGWPHRIKGAPLLVGHRSYVVVSVFWRGGGPALLISPYTSAGPTPASRGITSASLRHQIAVQPDSDLGYLSQRLLFGSFNSAGVGWAESGNRRAI